MLSHGSMIYIFKGTDLVDEESEDLQNNQNDIQELEQCFRIIDIPLFRFSHINPIKIVSVSQDGLNVAIYGGSKNSDELNNENTGFFDSGKNLTIYSYKTNSWHNFNDVYYSYLNINCNILWWQNEYIFLDNYNQETGDYEILMINVHKVLYSMKKTKYFPSPETPEIVRTNPSSSILELNSDCIIWKYPVGRNSISYINLDNSLNELIVLTSDMKLLVFKLTNETVSKTIINNDDNETSPRSLKFYKKQVSINIIIRLSIKNLNLDTKKNLGNFNLIKINENSNDLFMLINGNLYFLNLTKTNSEDNDNNFQYSYEQFLVYNNIEFINKIDNDSFYFFNGDEILYLNDLKIHYDGDNISENRIALFTHINNLKSLKISNFDEQFYPIILYSKSDYYINGLTINIMNLIKKNNLENDQDVIEHKKVLKISSTKKPFLHDLINFEIEKMIDHKIKEISEHQEKSLQEIYDKYHTSNSFEYSLELLLYMVATKNNENDSINNGDFKLNLILKLIKKLPTQYLSIIAKCLRKIEVQYWDRIFDQLNLTSKQLLNQCISLNDYKTAGYYLIILLSHKTNSSILIQRNNEELDEEDKIEIMNFLKIIVDNLGNEKYNKNNELWDMGIELIRFLKVLNENGEILKQAIEFLKD